MLRLKTNIIELVKLTFRYMQTIPPLIDSSCSNLSKLFEGKVIEESARYYIIDHFFFFVIFPFNLLPRPDTAISDRRRDSSEPLLRLFT